MTLFGTGLLSGDTPLARHSRNLVQYFLGLAAKLPEALSRFTCPCCAGNSYKIRMRRDQCRLIRCDTCEVEMFWPIPSADELTTHYTARNVYTEIGDNHVSGYLANPLPVRERAAYLDQKFRSFGIARGARILDLGCMHGLVSIELRRLGYEAWGVEPNPGGIKFLNEHGGQGYCGTIFDDACPVKSCDVAMGWHVFEHLADPYAAFRKIHEMLPLGGVLYFAVPHWGGLVPQKMEQRWKWFCYPEHLHYYSERTLLRALRSIGFRIESSETPASDEQVDEVFDAFEIAVASRTRVAREAAASFLKNFSLGEELVITAIRA
jgi:SAM-dependent methyltransferase